MLSEEIQYELSNLKTTVDMIQEKAKDMASTLELIYSYEVLQAQALRRLQAMNEGE